MNACASSTAGLNTTNVHDDSDEYQQAQDILQDFHRMHGQPFVIEEEEECSPSPSSSRGLIKSRTHMCLTDLLQSSSSEELNEDERDDEESSPRPMKRISQLTQYRFQKQAVQNLKYTSCNRRRRRKMRLSHHNATATSSC
jgi:hypothetical protein